MKIQILHQRDPDSECGMRVWVDGVEVRNVEVEDIDPGRGYDLEEWHADTELMTPGVDSFTDAVIEARNDAEGSEYVN